MFNGKSSQLMSDQERTGPNIPVDCTNNYAETIYASSSSGTFQPTTVFSIQPLSLRCSRACEGQKQEHEQERGQEQEKEAGQKDPSRQIIAGTRHYYKSTYQPIRRWSGLVLACIVVALLVGCRGGDTATWNDLYSSGRRLHELGDKDSLAAAETKADHGLHESATRAPDWNWKFRVLKAEVLVWRGRAKDVRAL